MSTTQQFCTFYLGKFFLGVEVHKVQEVIRYQTMTRVPLAHQVVHGLINLRGQIVTAIDLRRRLEMPDRPQDQRPMNVVIRTEDGAVSLLVDEIGDVLEVSEDSLEAPPETLSDIDHALIRGIYKLEGKLLLALNTDAVMNLDQVSGDKASAASKK